MALCRHGPPAMSSVMLNSHLLHAKRWDIFLVLLSVCKKLTVLCISLVTMQAQREAPADMQCKDKFLVQSVVVTEGTTTKDVTGEMVVHVLMSIRWLILDYVA